MTPEERVNKALMDSLPDIVESLKKEVKESISWQVKNDVAKHVSQTVTEWYQENMLEEIKHILLEEKEGLMSMVPVFTNAVCDELLKALLDSLKKKFEQSWERQKILKSLFE